MREGDFEELGDLIAEVGEMLRDCDSNYEDSAEFRKEKLDGVPTLTMVS